MSLRDEDDRAAAVATAPRVTLDDVLANIASENWFTAGAAATALGQPSSDRMDVLTIYVATTRSGFIITGPSAPADSANYDEAVGQRIAKDEALSTLWSAMGYALREKLAAEA